MNLTRYNPNLDRGITTQPNVSGLRCFDGEDLCKLKLFHLICACVVKEQRVKLQKQQQKEWIQQQMSEKLAQKTMSQFEKTAYDQ